MPCLKRRELGWHSIFICTGNILPIRNSLKERAYPFLKDVAVYMEQNSIVDSKGFRRLEFSSSPEIYDNSLQAWFKDMTNYDLSLMHFLFGAGAEMANELGIKTEAAHWNKLKSQLPDFDLDNEGSLTFAKGFPYNASHRHFSHALAIHPLGIIDWSDGEKAQRIIRATLKKMNDYGPDYWTGYTYSWFANMQARAFNGEEAAKALRTFAKCFCLKNTFHANGDQSASGKSKFTYRPFTLEGNFAFAAGIHEMLLQSHTGVIRVFPAVPESWKNVSFNNLRAMGGFLVSAALKDGKVVRLEITLKKGAVLQSFLLLSIKWWNMILSRQSDRLSSGINEEIVLYLYYKEIKKIMDACAVHSSFGRYWSR